MYKFKTITLCLPCRNEADNLPQIVASIPDFVDEVLLISNNSSDNSVAVGRQLGLKVIEENRTKNGIGYGYAHITGIEQASGNIIVGADCDGTYPLSDIGPIIDLMLKQQLDFVSCNRYPLAKNSPIPFKLKLGVSLLNWEVRLLYGKKINDILSGMWVFNQHAAELLSLNRGDWNLSPQIKLEAMQNPNIAFAERHIVQRVRLGHSHQQYFKTGLSHSLWIATNRFRQLAQLRQKALPANAGIDGDSLLD